MEERREDGERETVNSKSEEEEDDDGDGNEPARLGGGVGVGVDPLCSLGCLFMLLLLMSLQ